MVKVQTCHLKLSHCGYVILFVFDQIFFFLNGALLENVGKPTRVFQEGFNLKMWRKHQ